MAVGLYRKRVRFVEREPPGEPEWLAVHRAADRNISNIAAAFVAGIKILRDGVDPERVNLSLQRNDPGSAITSFPWDLWARAFDRLVTPRVGETMRSSGEGVGRSTTVHKQRTGFADPPPSGTLRGVFNLTNPRAALEASRIAARLVTRVDTATRDAMRQIIADAQATGVSLRLQADQLERVLIDMAGLDGPRARQLLRFEADQLARGVRPSIVEARVGILRDRLLLARAKTIARHETMDAAVAGQVELWNQAEEEGLLATGMLREWIITPDNRICPICEPMSGQRRARGDSFVSSFSGLTYERPPAHVLCLPGDSLVLPRGRVTAASKRWIDDDLVVIHVSDALPLTCTPNHPVLTREGWRAARLIDVGDEIAYPGIGQGTGDRDGQNIDRPTRIEDIAESFVDDPHVMAKPVPVSAEDFHGDGIASEIAIVGADSFLRHDVLDAGLSEFVAYTVFKRGHIGTTYLPRYSDPPLNAWISDFAPRSVMSSYHLAGTLLHRHMRPFDLLSLRSSTALDAGFVQPQAYRTAVDTISFGKSVLGLSAQVEVNDLIYRKVMTKGHRQHSGLVYNLETESGYYLANGYVTHNCRCALGLVDPDEE